MAADVATRSEFSLLADLAREGSLTSTALYLPDEVPYENWEALGIMLGRLHHASCFLVGDWINYGEDTYADDKYLQAVEETGLAKQTLMNYASVARRVPPSRRRASLPYSYHAVVAPLEPDLQEVWLAEAEKHGWTRRQLDVAVKGQPEDEMHLTCPTCDGKGWVVPTREEDL